MYTFAAFTYVQKKGVRVYKCFICQMVFKKVWLPQQLPQSCDLQYDTSCTLHSRVSFPLVGVSGVIWCQFSVTFTAAPTSPLKVAQTQLMEWRQLVQTNVCFHILLHFGLVQVLVASSSMIPWSPL